jgi:hypothetical protein
MQQKFLHRHFIEKHSSVYKLGRIFPESPPEQQDSPGMLV